MNPDLYQPSSQEAREQDYATSGVFKKKTDASDLHMFFSPYIVPEGLTDDEIRQCLAWYGPLTALRTRVLDASRRTIEEKMQECLGNDYALLEKAREALSCVFGESAFGFSVEEIARMHAVASCAEHQPIPIPFELAKSPATRECFAAGMQSLIARIESLNRLQ